MTSKQIDQFRKDFKIIIYQYSQIQKNGKMLKGLHAWDKNGSHEKAIIKRLTKGNGYRMN